MRRMNFYATASLTGLLFVASPAAGQQTTTTDSNSSGMAMQTGSQTTTSQTTPTRSVASNQKLKLRGIVARREGETFTVRDESGADTTVRLTERTSIKTKGGFLRSGSTYPVTNILRGLNVEVDGRGDAAGQLVAERIRFRESDLRLARTLETRVNPVEDRVGGAENRISDVEQNAQRLSGQLDELAAVSNAARGGAKAAQETADQAVAGVRATNERISALDEYTAQDTATVTFRVGSAVISPEGRAELDRIAQSALAARGYTLEVTGFADATGDTNINRRLSQKRADAVVRYLVETYPIPLRRITTPFGYGEAQPIAENTTREGRSQNRRVEVKVLVNRGLTQPAPATETQTTSSTTGAAR